jgi:hypothetical protein
MTRTKHRFNKLQPVDSDYGYYFCKHTYMPALRLPRTLRDADQILPIFL